MRIMLIDDDPLFANLVRSRLEKEGFVVTFNEGAFGALTRARESQPDLILVDVQMPEIEGPKLIGYLCGRGIGTPRILLLSSIPEADLRHAAGAFGAHGYICKGWGLDEITSCVRAALKPEPGPKSPAPGAPVGADHRAGVTPRDPHSAPRASR